MKYDTTSIRNLIKKATTIFMDDELYEIEWCAEHQFQVKNEFGDSEVFWYEDIDLNEVFIYQTILLNP